MKLHAISTGIVSGINFVNNQMSVDNNNGPNTELSASSNEPVDPVMTSNNTKSMASTTASTAPAMTSSNIDPDDKPGSIKQPITCNCFVSLPKLTEVDIDMYKPLPPPLSELDTNDEEIISCVKYGMSLRDRKKKEMLRPL